MIGTEFFAALMWEDVAIAFGTFVGILTKSYALMDERTVWSRKASGTNAILYPPSLAAFWSPELYVTFFVVTVTMCLW